MSELNIGDVIKCKVTGVESYGIFVSLESKMRGLIHISEITKYYVRNIEDYAKVGDTIYCKVMEINKNENKVKLSIKAVSDEKKEYKAISESANGFDPLEKMLPKWTKEKMDEIIINRDNN